MAVRAGWGMAVGEASAGFDDRAVDRSSVTRAKGNIGHGSAENISRVGRVEPASRKSAGPRAGTEPSPGQQAVGQQA